MKPLSSFFPPIRRAILLALPVVIAFTFAASTAFAQHAGMRPGTVPRIAPSHVIAPRIFWRTGIYPVRPLFPFFSPTFGLWGAPFYGFGLGLGFHPVRWRSCGPYWGWAWGYDCYAFPVYVSGGGNRELPQLYLKDGTVYNVTDYWLVDNKLHFTTIDESGTKWVQHTIDFSQLDLQKTTDVSKQRGFNFVLRNEPMQQYLKDHPEIGAPGAMPSQRSQPSPPQP
jgi:hypothetical protein